MRLGIREIPTGGRPDTCRIAFGVGTGGMTYNCFFGAFMP